MVYHLDPTLLLALAPMSGGQQALQPISCQKELHPLGSRLLQENWEDTVSTALISFLDSKAVQWTSLDPVRMREVGDSAPPVIIWIGILPGSLSAIDGINIAIHCRSILCSPNLDDIHVETRESRVVQASKLYKPTSRFNPAANALMPQSPCICSSYPPIY